MVRQALAVQRLDRPRNSVILWGFAIEKADLSVIAAIRDSRPCATQQCQSAMALAVRHPRDAFNLGEGDSHRAITVRNFQRNPASISTGLRSLARTHFFLVNLIAQGDGRRASVVEKRINKNDKYNETKTSPYCVDAAGTRRLSDRARCDHHKHRSQTGSRPNPGRSGDRSRGDRDQNAAGRSGRDADHLARTTVCLDTRILAMDRSRL